MHYLRHNRRASHYRFTDILISIHHPDSSTNEKSSCLPPTGEIGGSRINPVHSRWLEKPFAQKYIYFVNAGSSFHANECVFLRLRKASRRAHAIRGSVSHCSDNVRPIANTDSHTWVSPEYRRTRSRNSKVFALRLHGGDIAVSVGVRELGELSGRDDTDVSHV